MNRVAVIANTANGMFAAGHARAYWIRSNAIAPVGMSSITLKGNLVHFAAFRTHIGFYPTPTGIEAFKEELSVYVGGKGSVQFPLDKPMPLDLIRRIVEFRVKENLETAEAKSKKSS